MENLNYQSVLIITYGRSGSTLLQGVLNSFNGFVVRGENYNFCYELFKSYKAIGTAKKQEGTNTVSHPWYGASSLNEEKLLDDYKTLIREQLSEGVEGDIFCYGFKEIRYTSMDIGDDFTQYLEFLRKIFPNPLFIFNTRDINSVIKSGWWKDVKEQEVRQLIQETEECFYKFEQDHENTFSISYEEIKAKNIQGLCKKIGVKYDEDALSKVLNKEHSYQPNEEDNQKPKVFYKRWLGMEGTRGDEFLKKEYYYRNILANNNYSNLASKNMIKNSIYHAPLSLKSWGVYFKYYSIFKNFKRS